MVKNIQISDVEVEVTKKKIKNIYLKVTADGRVRISAPKHISDETIRSFVTTKLDWIKKKTAKFKNQVPPTELKYMSGETHYCWGKPYILEVRHANVKGKVEIKSNKIILTVREGSSIEQKRKVMVEWYRAKLKQELPVLIAKWESIIGVKVDFVGVKNMRTRWGSCNITKKRVWFNLQLAKKPVRCLEYVVVHELVHLLEKNHNKVFWGYLDNFLPEWRVLKDKLNSL